MIGRQARPFTQYDFVRATCGRALESTGVRLGSLVPRAGQTTTCWTDDNGRLGPDVGRRRVVRRLNTADRDPLCRQPALGAECERRNRREQLAMQACFMCAGYDRFLEARASRPMRAAARARTLAAIAISARGKERGERSRGSRRRTRCLALDAYVIAGITGPITPWKELYRSLLLLGGDTTIVLSAAGHIRGWRRDR
jgi:hypothetical protein